MTPVDVRVLLARLLAVEAETREALRAARYALDDLASAHEAGRQVRAELAAVLDVEDVSVVGDASRPVDAMPTPSSYIVAIHGGDPCGRVRR